MGNLNSLIALAASTLLGTAVIAPTTLMAADTAAAEGTLEEVIVTAEKREQNFQKVALSAAVVTKAELTRTGVQTVEDAIRLVPGVKVQNIAGTGSGRVFIRGIGTTSGDEFNSIISNGVNLNLDGVNSNNASNAIASMFDVERVEVLKGPQGTLYGSSALGGVVNVITAKPQREFAALGKFQTGNYSQRSVQAMVNFPIGDKFAVRLTGNTNKRNGYVGGPEQYHVLFAPGPPGSPAIFDYYVPADNHGALDAESYRVKAQWKPGEKFTAFVSYEYTHDKGTAPTWVNADDVIAGNLRCCNLAPGAPPSAFTVQWYENRFNERKTETWSGEFNYDLGRIGVLTLLPSRNIIRDKGQELTTTQLNSAQYSQQTQNTYELRLNSPATSKVIWVAGLYKTTSDRRLIADTGLRAPSPNVDNNLNTIEYGIFEVGRPFDTFNAFAQATVPVSDSWRLTAGARYSKNEADYTYQLYRTANPCTPPPGPPGPGGCPTSDTVVQQSATIASKSSHPSTTWKIGFEHDLAADSMLYGTVATGFKSGGVQIRRNDLPITGLSPLPLGGYDNETSVSFEVGSKNRFLDNRLQVNGAVFYTRWDKMQLNTFVCITPGCIPFNQPTYTTWFNAGPSTQYGLELDTVWAVTSNDRVNFSATFMHGAYGKADYDWGAPNTQGGFDGHVHLGGRAMAQTPAAAANAAYSHAFHIGEGKLTTTLEGEYSAKYETTHEYFFAGHTQPSYFRTNASVTYEQGKVNINAFVRNAQNKSTIQSVFPFGVQGGEPRLYGASLQVAF